MPIDIRGLFKRKTKKTTNLPKNKTRKITMIKQFSTFNKYFQNIKELGITPLDFLNEFYETVNSQTSTVTKIYDTISQKTPSERELDPLLKSVLIPLMQIARKMEIDFKPSNFFLLLVANLIVLIYTSRNPELNSLWKTFKYGRYEMPVIKSKTITIFDQRTFEEFKTELNDSFVGSYEKFVIDDDKIDPVNKNISSYRLDRILNKLQIIDSTKQMESYKNLNENDQTYVFIRAYFNKNPLNKPIVLPTTNYEYTNLLPYFDEIKTVMDNDKKLYEFQGEIGTINSNNEAVTNQGHGLGPVLNPEGQGKTVHQRPLTNSNRLEEYKKQMHESKSHIPIKSPTNVDKSLTNVDNITAKLENTSLNPNPNEYGTLGQSYSSNENYSTLNSAKRSSSNKNPANANQAIANPNVANPTNENQAIANQANANQAIANQAIANPTNENSIYNTIENPAIANPTNKNPIYNTVSTPYPGPKSRFKTEDAINAGKIFPGIDNVPKRNKFKTTKGISPDNFDEFGQFFKRNPLTSKKNNSNVDPALFRNESFMGTGPHNTTLNNKAGNIINPEESKLQFNFQNNDSNENNQKSSLTNSSYSVKQPPETRSLVPLPPSMKILIPGEIFNEITKGLSGQFADMPGKGVTAKKKDCGAIFDFKKQFDENDLVVKCEGKNVLIVSHNKRLQQLIGDMFPNFATQQNNKDGCKFGIANCSVLEIYNTSSKRIEELKNSIPKNPNHVNITNKNYYTKHAEREEKLKEIEDQREDIENQIIELEKQGLYKLRVLFDGFPDKEKCEVVVRKGGAYTKKRGNKGKKKTKKNTRKQKGGASSYHYLNSLEENILGAFFTKNNKDVMDSGTSLFEKMFKNGAKKIILMRHGNGPHNKPYSIKTIRNPPLTALGVYQAHLAGKSLKSEEDLSDLDNLFVTTSQLKRAQQTTLQFLSSIFHRFPHTLLPPFIAHAKSCLSEVYNLDTRNMLKNKQFSDLNFEVLDKESSNPLYSSTDFRDFAKRHKLVSEENIAAALKKQQSRKESNLESKRKRTSAEQAYRGKQRQQFLSNEAKRKTDEEKERMAEEQKQRKAKEVEAQRQEKERMAKEAQAQRLKNIQKKATLATQKRASADAELRETQRQRRELDRKRETLRFNRSPQTKSYGFTIGGMKRHNKKRIAKKITKKRNKGNKKGKKGKKSRKH